MMIRIALAALISLLSFLVKAQEGKDESKALHIGVTITVTIPKTISNNGKVYFALFNSKETFNQRKSFQNATGVIKENTTVVNFENVPVGIYAITCFHDVNDNKQLDFDGMRPIEDYGTSNNPQLFGPPQFDLAKFEVTDTNLTFEINF